MFGGWSKVVPLDAMGIPRDSLARFLVDNDFASWGCQRRGVVIEFSVGCLPLQGSSF
jgi:hypothetical protein